jgi:Ca2+-binding EF-hand superfamily protein
MEAGLPGMMDPPVDIENELLRLFTRFDADRDGLIDEQEFREILQTLGDDPSNEVLSLNFAAIDSNPDGMVNFPELMRWWLDDR